MKSVCDNPLGILFAKNDEKFENLWEQNKKRNDKLNLKFRCFFGN